MGLDMYVYCNDRELTHDVQEEAWRASRGDIMYWRKANAIHKWIIDNAEYSSGEDDCDTFDLTVEDMWKLLKVCKKVLEHHDRAPELLPTCEGFFFGSQEYDEWYFEDVKYTAETLERILNLIKPAEPLDVPEGQYAGFVFPSDYVYKHNDWILKFEYHASW